eukprot:TRINITY_DN93758_c0_g1_i1.p1 TRINITY_DN93758_c0_g1~~TRINITY_DN93758_c0_g1_i1.p1  ORF type:complete len:451 (-),score=167.36 TRINITY_DN93758_c0_g1_i1:379-1731(-)
MAGIIAQLPGGDVHFLPIAETLLVGCASKVAHHVRKLLRPKLGISNDLEEDADFDQSTIVPSDSEEFEQSDEDEDFRIIYRERDLEDENNAAEFVKALGSGRPAMVRILFRLLGGKGGFGALLRSQKGGKKTTNFDAMRDLSGRRIRHAKAVERIKGWLEQKKRDDELVDLLTGQGPELAKPTPVEETLDPAFVEKLKRAAASRPSVVAAGLKRIAEEAAEASAGNSASSSAGSEDAKRPRFDAAMGAAAAVASEEERESIDWLGALDALGELSSPDGEEEGDDTKGSSSSSSAGASSSSKAVVAEEKPRSNGSTASSVKAAAAPAPVVKPAPVAPAAKAPAAAPAAAPAPAVAAAAAQPKPAEKVAPPADLKPIQPEDLKKYSSADDLLKKVSADVLKISLQKLGLKCGGRPEDRAKRFFELKGKSLKDLPKSFFAPAAKEKAGEELAW